MAELLVQLIGLVVFAMGLWLFANLLGIGIATTIERVWRRLHG